MHIRSTKVEDFRVENFQIEGRLYDKSVASRLAYDLNRKHYFGEKVAEKLAVSMASAIWYQHSTFRDGSAAESVLRLVWNHQADTRICSSEYVAEVVDLLHTTLPQAERLEFLSLLNSDLGRAERAEVYPRFYTWARAHALIPTGMTDKQWF